MSSRGDIVIHDGGLLTSIQDKGRWGFQEYGISVAGAMDDYSLRLANILVGNDQYAVAIETTVRGPEIEFNTDAVIAITGANMLARVNGCAVPMWRAIKISKGDVLAFEFAIEGARGYIAFKGGLDIPAVMGSCSTYSRGNIGGYQGRRLKKGDGINLIDKRAVSKEYDRQIPEQYIPAYTSKAMVKVVLGPQEDYFTKESIDVFLSSEYEITNEADRMGYRLSGPALQHKNGADIISDGISLGAIQVPGHGMPIIMMADRQTTGGYTKIGGVISADMPLLAQLKPGDKISFQQVDIKEAHKLLKAYEERIEQIKRIVTDSGSRSAKLRRYNLKINSKNYQVSVEEI